MHAACTILDLEKTCLRHNRMVTGKTPGTSPTAAPEPAEISPEELIEMGEEGRFDFYVDVARRQMQAEEDARGAGVVVTRAMAEQVVRGVLAEAQNRCANPQPPGDDRKVSESPLECPPLAPRDSWAGTMLVGQTIGSAAKGEFTIEKELGSGAMGTVYRATLSLKDKKLPVALKVVALGLLGNESAMARFERESAILQQLRHPHIVRLYGTGKYRGTPYIAMEFVDGEPLDRALTRRGRLGWDEAFGYAKQLCEALHHAHEKGIIHRDLKPSNLMITREGTLKLTDFGIAKDADVTALTGANSTIGTAAYMSPEQCRGTRELTAKSDLYSLGVVLYELITGKKPFYAENSMDMFLKHVNETPVRPSKLIPDLPVWVDNLIMHLMEKAPETRPLDAATVGRMITEIEEKVQSQRSAGQEVATARRVDRKLTEHEMSVEDREALRALKGKKKKKKKKESVPLTQRTWVKALGIVTVLTGLIVVGAWLMWPIGPEKAFEEVRQAATTNDRLDRVKAYLAEYGDKEHPKVNEARAMFKDLRTKQADQQLVNRYGSDDPKKPNRRKAQDGEDEKVMESVWAGITAERAGKLKEASDNWAFVRDNIPEADQADYSREDAMRIPPYRWVAEKRLADIAAVGEEYKRVVGVIEKAHVDEAFPKYEPTNPEGKAVLGVRLERVKDPAKASQVWDALAQAVENDPDRARWLLMAAERKVLTAPEKGKEDEAKANRKALVKQMLAGITMNWDAVKSDPLELVRWREVRNACRDLIDLYEDEADDDIKATVSAAKKILTEAAAK